MNAQPLDIAKLCRQGHIDRYSSLALAQAAAARRTKQWMVMMGDDGKFWVVIGALSDKLHQLGYEFVR